jgi:hypothetical protein
MMMIMHKPLNNSLITQTTLPRPLEGERIPFHSKALFLLFNRRAAALRVVKRSIDNVSLEESLCRSIAVSMCMFQ